MSMGRTIVASIVSALIGATGMYFYTNGRVVQASQLVVQYHELEKQNHDLQTAKAELELKCTKQELKGEWNDSERTAYVALVTKQNVQIRDLRRRLLVVASKHVDAQAVRDILKDDADLATEFSAPSYRENWLHVVARSDKAGIGEVARAFIDFGADRDARNVDDQRPIDIARCCGTGEVLDVLKRYRPKEPIRVSAN